MATVRSWIEGAARFSEACPRERGPCRRHERNQKHRFDLRGDLIEYSKLFRERTNRVVGSTDSFASKTDTRLELFVRNGEKRDARQGETLGVGGEVPSKHRVQPLRRPLDERRLEETGRISPDTSLKRGT